MKWTVNKRGDIYNLADNKLRVCIHKLVGLGDMLFLTCHPLNIDGIDLHTENFDEAVDMAKLLIQERVNAIYHEMQQFVYDETDNEISRY